MVFPDFGTRGSIAVHSHSTPSSRRSSNNLSWHTFYKLAILVKGKVGLVEGDTIVSDWKCIQTSSFVIAVELEASSWSR
jgi:hypothetical protein